MPKTGWLRGKDILGMGPLNWEVTIGIVTFHLMALLAVFYVTWNAVLVAFVLYLITGWLGVTLCYHRLLTHESFKTTKIVRYALTTLGVLAFQGGPITWIGNHRAHHKHSDTDEDPHTPLHGFHWAHIVWMLFKKPEGFEPSDLARELKEEPVMVFFERFFWLPQVILAGSLYTTGYIVGGSYEALAWLLWGVGVRTIVTWHITWFVNSASHTWGYRNFDVNDNSRNNWWVALLGFGEGWHNNHHKQQGSASHGMRWFELDMTYWIIVLLSWVGLAWNIKKPRMWSKGA